MPGKVQSEQRLSERVVKEAVSVGMETPLRDSILEAVDESGRAPSSRSRRLPLAGALVGLGVAAGYLLGTKGTELQSDDLSLESIDEPDVVEELTETEDEMTEEMTMDEESADDDTDADTEDPSSSGGRLRKLVLALGLVGGIALARRRLKSSEEEEWEPIEEFETSVSPESEDEEEGEDEGEGVEAEDEDEDEDEEEEMEMEMDAEDDEADETEN